MNGCHNRKPLAGAYGSYGLDSKTGEIRYFEVPNPNTKDCQYCKTELGKSDKGCDGCKWRINA